VQRASRRNGDLYHWTGPLAAARNVSMRVLGGERLLARYDWLYGGRMQTGVGDQAREAEIRKRRMGETTAHGS
jgi:hypothetical protein